MLTVRQVADRLKAGVSSVRLWAKQQKFPGATFIEAPNGAYWAIPESALAAFEKRGPGRPPIKKAPRATIKAGRPKKSKNKIGSD